MTIGEDYQRPNGHAIFAPSSAHRVMACTASLHEELQCPDTAGFDAAYGTVAHDIAAKVLTEGITEAGALGEKHRVDDFNITVDQKMIEIVEGYVEYCSGLMRLGNSTVPPIVCAETRVDISPWTPIPNQGGTADFYIIDEARRLVEIVDLKTGYVFVDVRDNPQFLLYALGVLHQMAGRADRIPLAFGDWRVRIHVFQPTCKNIKHQDWRVPDLLEWGAKAAKLFRVAWEGKEATFQAGDHCTYCKICTTCAARALVYEKLVDDSFENLETKISVPALREYSSQAIVKPQTGRLSTPVDKLSTEFLVFVHQNAETMRAWFRDIERELLVRGTRGEPLPGLKIVNGRRSRSFVQGFDLPAEFEWLTGNPEDAYKPKETLSPAEAEAALVKNGYKKASATRLLERYITSEPGPRKLVPASSEQEDYTQLANESFDDLTNT